MQNDQTDITKTVMKKQNAEIFIEYLRQCVSKQVGHYYSEIVLINSAALTSVWPGKTGLILTCFLMTI